jgi:hypothetical protein
LVILREACGRVSRITNDVQEPYRRGVCSSFLAGSEIRLLMYIVSEVTENNRNYCRRCRPDEDIVVMQCFYLQQANFVVAMRSEYATSWLSWRIHSTFMMKRCADALQNNRHIQKVQTSIRQALLVSTKASESGAQPMCLSALDIVKPNDWLEYRFSSRAS